MANLASTYRNQGRWKEAEELFVQVMETFKRVLGQEHPDTLTSIANLAMTYMSQGRRTEAKELQIEAVNRLWTTLGEDHPSTAVAIANLASFHEERAAPAPLSGANDLTERLRDRILQFAASWSLDQGKDGQERLESSPEMSQKHATEHGDETRLKLALAMSLEVDDNNDISEERIRRSQDSSVEADVDNQTNAEQLLIKWNERKWERRRFG